ncbi:hypothetical protein K504DRAFT_184831 [Pleomassaria siparia CBS 279.74]|uniref:Uncharacterized protein n=1 Tax=Pleomassaria siparia CBS 279.74 TaxID=1314801 RepID=A0A6G1JSK3_9PLEO|nr:hypothetical protein K504DRAFT_184831 [Pleomassaria siparia CBS 279.74]
MSNDVEQGNSLCIKYRHSSNRPYAFLTRLSIYDFPDFCHACAFGLSTVRGDGEDTCFLLPSASCRMRRGFRKHVWNARQMFDSGTSAFHNIQPRRIVSTTHLLCLDHFIFHRPCLPRRPHRCHLHMTCRHHSTLSVEPSSFRLCLLHLFLIVSVPSTIAIPCLLLIYLKIGQLDKFHQRNLIPTNTNVLLLAPSQSPANNTYYTMSSSRSSKLTSDTPNPTTPSQWPLGALFIQPGIFTPSHSTSALKDSLYPS